MNTENHDEDIFQALENRQDIDFSHPLSPPNQDLEKHDFSRFDAHEIHNHKHDFPQFRAQEARVDKHFERLHADDKSQYDDNINKDPLYVVHFVPSPKPKVESSSSDSSLGSTVSNEVLQKILSASKGTKPGTPQFVVFAPVPEEVEAEKGKIFEI